MRAKIYKNQKTGKWIVDLYMDPTLLSMFTTLIRLKNGTTVGRLYYDSWNEAREFLFGPIH